MPAARMPRWTLVASLALALPLAGTALGLDAMGRSARVVGRARRAGEGGGALEVRLVANAPAAYRQWRNAGVRGRTLVHLGRFLHFVPVQEDEPTTGACTDVPIARAEARLDNRNFLWVAGYSGIVRRIFYVVPPERFVGKPRGGWDRIDASGFERRVSSRLPELREPVLLEIHASYFEATDGDALLEDLRSSGLETDLAILDLAQDGPDVSERARERLRAFGRTLAARELAPEPSP